MGSIIGYGIDFNGVVVLRGTRHIPRKESDPSIPPELFLHGDLFATFTFSTKLKLFASGHHSYIRVFFESVTFCGFDRLPSARDPAIRHANPQLFQSAVQSGNALLENLNKCGRSNQSGYFLIRWRYKIISLQFLSRL